MKEKVLVSACLLGAKCRYDGEERGSILEMPENWCPIPFCPEIYGGLPTPRVAAERVGEKVLTKDGRDVTEEYEKGADEALKMARRLGIKKAVLKERSPSCGKGYIYDGTFSTSLTKGNGVTAELLMKNGIEVFGESEIGMK